MIEFCGKILSLSNRELLRPYAPLIHQNKNTYFSTATLAYLDEMLHALITLAHILGGLSRTFSRGADGIFHDFFVKI
jgi:hypothetical protein